MKISYIMFVFFILFGCKENKRNIELSTKALKHFREIFNNLEVNGEKFNINKVFYLKKPNIDEKLINTNELKDITFFKLVDDSSKYIIVSVNKNYCYASIANEFNTFVYPTNDVIYPSDFSFLNNENIEINIKCKNEDDNNFRNVSYQKKLIGKWTVDSIIEIRKNYKDDVILNTIKIVNANSLIINSKSKKKYINDGAYLTIEN